MKKTILIEIIRKLKERPDLLRKVKIFALVGLFCFVFLGVFSVWLGITAFQYVAAQTSEVIQSPVVKTNIEKINIGLKEVKHFQALHCWNKAHSLFQVEPWMQRSALENLQNLKESCFQQAQPTC